VLTHEILINLQNVNQRDFPENLKTQFQELIDSAVTQIAYWTKQELALKHISPIINSVKYLGSEYNTFANRNFGYDFGNLKLAGAMDYLISGGQKEPTVPYFCLHEYKKEQNFEGDPLGQLLAEMLVAQALNRDAKTGFETIYGYYIVGRNWFWVILKDKEYAVSRAYDSTRIGDLSDIYLILVKIKYIIETHIASTKKLSKA
jgi:hypothetical protein